MLLLLCNGRDGEPAVRFWLQFRVEKTCGLTVLLYPSGTKVWHYRNTLCPHSPKMDPITGVSLVGANRNDACMNRGCHTHLDPLRDC